MSGLPSTTPRTTVLSEFDEMMISKSIATREQRLRAKGFTAEQAAEILEAEAEELEAEEWDQEGAEADADTWPGCGVPVGCGPEPTLRLLDEPGVALTDCAAFRVVI